MGAEGLLGGRYRLDHVAGHGGMATVFAAHDTVLDRTVAIKLLQRRHDETGVLHARFAREARAEAKIVHPNVVSVHDVGEAEDGRPYIVMDYVEGRSLQEIIAEDAPLPSERVAVLGMGIARALAAAHALGIMHRDIKPGNVIVDAQGLPHLMDFGLARELYDRDDPGVTEPGVLVGTAFYVAPEQARYGTSSSAGDLYSLGAVMYHALAGEPPFPGDGALDVTLRRFEEDPPDLRVAMPAADPDLVAMINALLARDPVERPWDAASVAERLGDIGARLRATRTAGETQAPL
ncbi:MAG TPA: serine/threonine-protein kinase [Candidatus Elarobacter sp.]